MTITDEPAFAEKSQGPLSVGHDALTTRTALRIKDRVTFESWIRIGKHLSAIHDASGWWLADWLIFGERKYSERYAKAIAETNLDYQTLRNYAWVARRFPAARRRASLSLQHHAEVASQPGDEQDRWLDLAESNGWSKSQLRREIKASHEGNHTQQLTTLNIRVDVSKRLQWEKVAADNLCRLDEWIVGSLDSAAAAIACEAQSLGELASASAPALPGPCASTEE